MMKIKREKKKRIIIRQIRQHENEKLKTLWVKRIHVSQNLKNAAVKFNHCGRQTCTRNENKKKQKK